MAFRLLGCDREQAASAARCRVGVAGNFVLGRNIVWLRVLGRCCRLACLVVPSSPASVSVTRSRGVVSAGD